MDGNKEERKGRRKGWKWKSKSRGKWMPVLEYMFSLMWKKEEIRDKVGEQESRCGRMRK